MGAEQSVHFQEPQAAHTNTAVNDDRLCPKTESPRAQAMLEELHRRVRNPPTNTRNVVQSQSNRVRRPTSTAGEVSGHKRATRTQVVPRQHSIHNKNQLQTQMSLKEIFGFADRNKDGLITMDEAMWSLSQWFPKNLVELNAFRKHFTATCQNTEQVIDFEQFVYVVESAQRGVPLGDPRTYGVLRSKLRVLEKKFGKSFPINYPAVSDYPTETSEKHKFFHSFHGACSSQETDLNSRNDVSDVSSVHHDIADPPLSINDVIALWYFVRMDTNQDGYASMEDVKRCFEESGVPVAIEQLNDHFVSVDDTNFGYLTFPQFFQFLNSFDANTVDTLIAIYEEQTSTQAILLDNGFHDEPPIHDFSPEELALENSPPPHASQARQHTRALQRKLRSPNFSTCEFTPRSVSVGPLHEPRRAAVAMEMIHYTNSKTQHSLTEKLRKNSNYVLFKCMEKDVKCQGVVSLNDFLLILSDVCCTPVTMSDLRKLKLDISGTNVDYQKISYDIRTLV